MNTYASNFTTPVVFLLFNRPTCTREVFLRIREIRPSRLFVVADGPRKDRPAEAILCQEARAVIDEVDWPCIVERNFSDDNLGCGKRVTTGLDWVFARVGEAIIVEDDCLPHTEFFDFCARMLLKFAQDQSIRQINGESYWNNGRPDNIEYYAISYPLIWGWATWSDRWRSRGNVAQAVAEFASSDVLARTMETSDEREFWPMFAKSVIASGVDTWDFDWMFSGLGSGARCICPGSNLVSNTGWGTSGTHTFGDSHLSRRPTFALPKTISSSLVTPRLAQFETFIRRFYPHGGLSKKKIWLKFWLLVYIGRLRLA